jgi:hypothetical protein
MRFSSFSLASSVLSNVADAASTPATPAAIVVTATSEAKPAKRVRTIKLPTKPATTDAAPAKPAKLVKPATVAVVAKPEPAKPSRDITRTAATIAANATNFGGVLSDRDTAYIAFFASFAKAHPSKPVTVAELATSGRTPAYNGSAKPHDAGVVNRLAKAGLITKASDGSSFTFTKAGTTTKAYASAK